VKGELAAVAMILAGAALVLGGFTGLGTVVLCVGILKVL
jgi:hypothetical protein